MQLGFLSHLVPRGLRVPARYWKRRLARELEPELSWFLDSLHRGANVVDVGANFGNYTYAALRRGHHVHAFEPMPDCVADLRAYKHPRLKLYPFAVGAADATLTLHVPYRDGRYQSGLATLDTHWRDRQTNDIPVTVRRLDDLDLGSVDAIKIDVEGHELSVLDGAQETIAKNRPLLLIELVPKWVPIREAFLRIEAAGYRGTYLDRKLREQPVATYTDELDSPPRCINTFLWRPRR